MSIRKRKATLTATIDHIAFWTVIVGNVGTVLNTLSEDLARETYQQYVNYSREGNGRVSGEGVCLMYDDAVVVEYAGANNT